MYDLHSILIQLKKEDTPLHGVMVRCVRCFYQWLDPTLWKVQRCLSCGRRNWS